MITNSPKFLALGKKENNMVSILTKAKMQQTKLIF